MIIHPSLYRSEICQPRKYECYQTILWLYPNCWKVIWNIDNCKRLVNQICYTMDILDKEADMSFRNFILKLYQKTNNPMLIYKCSVEQCCMCQCCNVVKKFSGKGSAGSAYGSSWASKHVICHWLSFWLFIGVLP